MKFIIKLYPEITIKSPSVRLRFTKILTSNIRNILRSIDNNKQIAVVRHWDHIEVRSKQPDLDDLIAEELTRIPGIHHILAIKESRWTDLDDIFDQTLALNHERLVGKRFAVRVKRRGTHSFSSQDIERYVGGGLNQHIPSAKVKLTQPDEVVNLEIDQDRLLLVTARYMGLGGFPIGTQADVLSLLSGGFDSSVSSYMLLRRGSRVHYCFFNLGGTAHETGVRQVAHFIWSRFGRSHKVRFISIDFAAVVGEILEKVDDGQMAVVLKRMMLRAASRIAERYGLEALVTGEALGQVSSQTLTNLRVIDNVTDCLVLRPLISHDKEHIIRMAREIGTEDFAKKLPEYCGVISKNPTVKAQASHIFAEEDKFDFTILEQAVTSASNIDIRQLAQQVEPSTFEIETVVNFSPGEAILDIRAVEDQEHKPLQIHGIRITSLPFYLLGSQYAQLDQNFTWLLYCEHGVMSRLQALYLHDQGYRNMKIYRP